MYKLSEVQVEIDKKQAEELDFIDMQTIGAGRYGIVAYEALREYQPSVFLKFGFEETLEEWVLEQNEKWLNREMDLCVKFKDELNEVPVLEIVDRIYQATQAQEQAKEIVLKEVVQFLPVWEDTITDKDMISTF